MRHVMYIGSAPRQRDNIMHTARTWDQPGAVVEIPDDEAVHYFGHKDVFEDVTDMEADEREQRGQAIRAAIKDPHAKRPAQKATGTQLGAGAATAAAGGIPQVNAANAIRGNLERDPGNAAESAAAKEGRLVAKPEREIKQPKKAKPVDISDADRENIMTALGTLSPENPEHFDQETKRPVLTALQGLAGEHITQAQVDAIWTELGE